jgi:exopolysaccharide biosynthesis protein
MKQKLVRNALGYKDGVLYLAIVQQATVQELAEVMKAIGVEYALNLDGGYSKAMFYNDEYMVGPGRNIPNAIVFSEM